MRSSASDRTVSEVNNPARKKSVRSCACQRQHAAARISASMHTLSGMTQDTGFMYLGVQRNLGVCTFTTLQPTADFREELKGEAFLEGCLFKTLFRGYVV